MYVDSNVLGKSKKKKKSETKHIMLEIGKPYSTKKYEICSGKY